MCVCVLLRICNIYIRIRIITYTLYFIKDTFIILLRMVEPFFRQFVYFYESNKNAAVMLSYQTIAV